MAWRRSGNWACFGISLVLAIGPAVATAAEEQTANTSDPSSNTAWNALTAVDLEGNVRRIGEAESTQAVAVVFLSHECPISNQYISELNRIAKDQTPGAVEFYGVLSDRGLSRTRAVVFAKEFAIEFPILFDASGEIAERLAPTHVPESFVFTRRGELAYRGRINDQFASLGKRRPMVTDNNLKDALAAVIAGESPSVARTEVVGCKLELARMIAPAEKVTFHRDVAPILYANCVQCHRPGEVAPFSLLTYDDASKRAEFIAEITHERRMPPWKVRPDYGHFLGDRRLSDHELGILQAWADAGAPAGDVADAPPEPKFVEGWQLGEPDLVVTMTEAYSVPASGPDVFRFFVIPIDIPEDKIVTAVEFRPGNPRIVHHAIMYVDRTGKARERDVATPEPGYEGFLTGGFRPSGVLGFWAPGYTARTLPDGVGMGLHPKSDLAMQLHYHPSGKDEVDQSQVGIHFADKPVEHELGGIALINFDVDIPAGEKHHRMDYSFTLPIDTEILEVVPHMHIIGTEMKVTATKPDGSVVPLVWIDWDFNWQDQFRYVEPIHLPAGTRLDMEAYFDNSADNPNNPSSPPKRVGFGEMTTDEMCICAFRTIETTSGDDRRKLRDALEASLQEQMKKPSVALTIARFILAGGGGGIPGAGSRGAEEAKVDPGESIPE